MSETIVLSPGRYAVTIETPLVSAFGDGLRERLTSAHGWLTANGGTVESYSPTPNGYFVIFALPREARWEFDFGEDPERIPDAVKDRQSFAAARPPTAFEAAAETARPVVETAETVVRAGVDLASGGVGGVGKALFLLWLLTRLGK